MVVCDLFSGNENVTYAVGLSLVLLGDENVTRIFVVLVVWLSGNENVTPKNGVFVGECGFANYGFVIKPILVDGLSHKLCTA